MTDLPQITGSAPHRALVQGGGILLVPGLLSVILSYRVAAYGGASAPVAAADLTAALCTLGAAIARTALYMYRLEALGCVRMPTAVTKPDGPTGTGLALRRQTWPNCMQGKHGTGHCSGPVVICSVLG